MRSSITKRSGPRVLAILATVVLACTIAAAEDGGEQAEKKEVLTELELRMEKKISVDFRDMPIDDVIRIMAEQADVDIIKSPSVTGNVTAKLTEVPLGEALGNILAAHGYGYVADKNMIRVSPMSEITQMSQTMVHKIYHITYANVLDIEKALNKFKSQQGMVSANPGTSHLIVTDTEAHIKAIDTFIEQIDRITPQILVECRIYDITCRTTLDLGIEWEAGRNTTYDGGIGVNPSGGRTDPFMTGGFLGATSETEDTTGAFRIGWLNDSIDLDAILRAQQEDIDAKLLANPRILVLDNEQAVFDIIREIPYTETTAAGGGLATETIKFKEVGVKLVVTPHVARDGMLRLHILPEFGVVVGQDPVTGVVTVDTRRVNTIALVKDGQTVVLGGLRKKDVSSQTNKIPLLGDLPLVGVLFRFEGEDTANTELVVFITPTIVEQPLTMTDIEAEAYKATEFCRPAPVPTRAERACEVGESEQ
jgi:type IV pilus assembly protein PilQ